MLSLPTLPLTINILFPLQKFNNRLPNLFLDLSILILLSGIFKSFSTFVKLSTKSVIDIVNTDSKYVMWFKCSEQLFKTDQPIFFGVVYIPPEYTKYSSEDAFGELQQEYFSFSNTYDSQ
jgi:uncharacterized membrane protein YobD (UPF0266 family)